MQVCVRDCSGNPFVFLLKKKTKDCNEKPARRERPNYKKSNFYRYLTVIHLNQMLCAINLNWD